jgi:hypothetical protein
MLPKSSRTFSRAIVVTNCAAAWLLVAGGVYAGPATAQIVVPAALTLIAWLVAGYMGVGAVDFRTAAAAARPEGPKP